MNTLQNELSKVWKDQKMIDYCIKSSVYVDMGDYWLDVCKTTPKIDKTIYYADTDYSTGDMAKDPGTAFETFRSNNNRLNGFIRLIEELEKDEDVLTIIDQYSRVKTNLKSWVIKHYHTEFQPYEREATPEERKVILETLKEQQIKYEKRLANYYKRYGKHVSTSSYWADR